MDLPMLFPTGEIGSRALMGLYEKYLKSEYPDVKMLFLYTGQPMQIHMVKKPIRTVADFKGVKMRCTAGTPSEVAKLTGATPVVMATPEIYEALQRGIVEGTFISWESITQMGWHELLKYHTEANLFAVPFYVVMNMKSWQKLPPDVQKQIDEVSGDWAARMAGKNWDTNCAKTKEQIKAMGGHEFIQMSPEETDKLRKIVSSRPDSWIKDMESKGIPGREIYNETVRLVKKYSE
jgi:TRAP-type transport system periplasmic protein